MASLLSLPGLLSQSILALRYLKPLEVERIDYEIQVSCRHFILKYSESATHIWVTKEFSQNKDSNPHFLETFA